MKPVIIYASSNKEDPLFEGRIIDNLLKQSQGIPIISVTQKPLKLGTNICVGDEIGVTGFNFFRQVLIGMEASQADYVISAEADTVYPPDYFQFVPPRLDVPYRNTNLYVMGDHRSYWFHKPEGATHSQVVGRQFYIETLKKLFHGAPQWSSEEKNFPKERTGQDDVFNKIEYWQTNHPVFQIKTHRSMRYYTRSERIPIYTLPYWGDGKTVREYYMKGVKEKYEN